MEIFNILSNLPADRSEEIFEIIASGRDFKLERIISSGQVTPDDQWYDQHNDEWVVLLKGMARIVFESNSDVSTSKVREVELHPGDSIMIPARRKHRVSYTSTSEPTIWIALHFNFTIVGYIS